MLAQRFGKDVQEGGLPIHRLGGVQLQVTPTYIFLKDPIRFLIARAQVLSSLLPLGCGVSSRPPTLSNSKGHKLMASNP